MKDPAPAVVPFEMNHHLTWKRLGAVLIVSLLLVAATPSCLMGHCDMSLGSGETQTVEMMVAMGCCTDSCPMTDPKSCETMMEGETHDDVVSTSALPSFQVSPPATPATKVTGLVSGSSETLISLEIGLDALDSSPPTHLLNSQFLI